MLRVLLYSFKRVYITTRFIVEIQFSDLKLKTVYHAVVLWKKSILISHLQRNDRYASLLVDKLSTFSSISSISTTEKKNGSHEKIFFHSLNIIIYAIRMIYYIFSCVIYILCKSVHLWIFDKRINICSLVIGEKVVISDLRTKLFHQTFEFHDP